MAMEMAMMGLLGTVVGASAMGASGGLRSRSRKRMSRGSRLPRTVGSR